MLGGEPIISNPTQYTYTANSQPFRMRLALGVRTVVSQHS